MMRFSPTILTAIFTLLQWHKSASASITFFTNKAEWEDAVGSTNFIVETFDNLPDEFTPNDGRLVELPDDTPMDFGTDGIEYISTVSGINPADSFIVDKNRNLLPFGSPVDGSDYLLVQLRNVNNNGGFRDWQMKSTNSFPIAAFSLDYIHIAGAPVETLRMTTDDTSEDFDLTISTGTANFLGAIIDPPTFDITLGAVDDLLRGNFDNFQFHFDSCLDDDAKTEPGICGCGVADVDSDNNGIADCNEEEELDVDEEEEEELDEEDECGVLFTRNCK